MRGFLVATQVCADDFYRVRNTNKKGMWGDYEMSK